MLDARHRPITQYRLFDRLEKQIRASLRMRKNPRSLAVMPVWAAAEGVRGPRLAYFTVAVAVASPAASLPAGGSPHAPRPPAPHDDPAHEFIVTWRPATATCRATTSRQRWRCFTRGDEQTPGSGTARSVSKSARYFQYSRTAALPRVGQDLMAGVGGVDVVPDPVARGSPRGSPIERGLKCTTAAPCFFARWATISCRRTTSASGQPSCGVVAR